MAEEVPLKSLRVGATLHAAVFDRHNPQLKLLAAQTEVTSELVDRLEQRGIESVAVSEQDAASMLSFRPQGRNVTVRVDRPAARSKARSRVADRLDTRGHDGAGLTVSNKSGLLLQQIEPRQGSYDPKRMETASQQHESHVETLASIQQQSHISRSSLDELSRICDETLSRALDDIDLFTCLGINPRGSTYPARHSLHVATLATAMGVSYGLGRPDLEALSLGCLLHDIGMPRVPGQPHLRDHELSDEDFAPITDHSLIALDMLESCELPEGALFVVYQMHERCDASGYPRGRSREEIHELAKLAAIADTFVALVSPRPYRNGLMPHFAISRLLAGVKTGIFDADCMRALLEVVSLFPLGSYIELEHDQVARVIRANRLRFDRPVVETWRKGQVDATPEIADLAEEPCRVLRPLRDLT